MSRDRKYIRGCLGLEGKGDRGQGMEFLFFFIVLNYEKHEV